MMIDRTSAVAVAMVVGSLPHHADAMTCVLASDVMLQGHNCGFCEMNSILNFTRNPEVIFENFSKVGSDLHQDPGEGEGRKKGERILPSFD